MSTNAKTAIVTGAAQGIGEAVALRLWREGFTRLLLIDRQADKLAGVAQALTIAGADVENLVLDLTDVAALTRDVDAAVAELGHVDALVNAAGTTARGGLSDTAPETFDLIFQLNVRAPFFMMQRIAPAMKPGGVIVNICSMLAYGGPPFLLAYSSSKAALAALTKGAANTLKRNGLRAFGINLGWTWTPAEQEVQTKVHGLAEDWSETLGAKQPFGRLLMPEDPAGLIAFLTSKDATMMTGAIIDLDQYVAGTVDDNPGV
ncbi:MAG: SDR family oxidoreductase [Candidatus Latescibacteria bacterium]|nr:SDR family oxidoreductase [Candidatus Latescibacterota bacterium]